MLLWDQGDFRPFFAFLDGSSGFAAKEIFAQINRLVHHYRSTPGGLPHWIRQFVTTGYSHYATQLPTACGDRENGGLGDAPSAFAVDSSLRDLPTAKPPRPNTCRGNVPRTA